jgi:hypothetical protein
MTHNVKEKERSICRLKKRRWFAVVTSYDLVNLIESTPVDIPEETDMGISELLRGKSCSFIHRLPMYQTVR